MHAVCSFRLDLQCFLDHFHKWQPIINSFANIACVAAVSFPFPNARERGENCERVAKQAVGGGGEATDPLPLLTDPLPIFWLTPGVLHRSPAFRSLVRSPRRLKKERNRLLRRLLPILKLALLISF